MLWQIPFILVQIEPLYHQFPFKLGHLSVTENGSIRVKIGSHFFIVDVGVPLRTLHDIYMIHFWQRCCIRLGCLKKRIVLSLNLRSLIHKSENISIYT